MARTAFLICSLGALTLASPLAHADEAHYSTAIGLKGVEVGHRKAGHTAVGSGIGAFVERSFWDHEVELELSVVAANLDSHLVMPIDVMIKHAHGLGGGVCVFAGAGASVVVDDEAESRASSGIAAVIGAYYWATPHWGIDMEVDYNVLLVGDLGQEITMAAGPVVRF